VIARRHLPFLGILLAASLAACQTADRAEVEEAASEAAAEPSSEVHVVEVTARDYALDAPEEIPSGWTTFRLTNVGQEEHFLYIYRLPENKTYQQLKEEALGPFYRVWEQYASGEIDRAEAEAGLGSEIPGWFFTKLEPSGGPALTEPGETSQATVRLEPGTYVMECYVKTPEGEWHTELGMQRELTVTADSTGASPPETDAELTLSNYQITTSGDLTAGTRTVAVRVEENPEGFMMHDVNLFRLEGGVEVQEIVEWMDWMDLEEFRAPAPGYSLGGVEHMLAGRTGYLTVELEPGDYVWVSEVYAVRGMVKEFTIE
jgi:uncharacterized cupredoxin-like copper-binding protein